ncbi:MAG: hypothetical protein MUD12_16985 [Spirochaetes bacterium]|nr:hypothetical protein [Spirochaetota bacterium]
MKKALISFLASGLLILPGCAGGINHPHGPAGPFPDMDGDGRITRVEWTKFHNDRIADFGLIDENRDGYLTPQEMGRFHEKKMRGGFRPPPPGPGPLPFMKIDADGDGAVTREEWITHHNELFKRLDRNGDGRLTPDELGAFSPGPPR